MSSEPNLVPFIALCVWCYKTTNNNFNAGKITFYFFQRLLTLLRSIFPDADSLNASGADKDVLKARILEVKRVRHGVLTSCCTARCSLRIKNPLGEGHRPASCPTGCVAVAVDDLGENMILEVWEQHTASSLLCTLLDASTLRQILLTFWKIIQYATAIGVQESLLGHIPLPVVNASHVEERWCHLYDPSSNSRIGEVRLELSIEKAYQVAATSSPEHHELLARLFLSTRWGTTSSEDTYREDWLALLPEESEYLLSIHAVQTGLTETVRSACCIEAIWKLQRSPEHRRSYRLIEGLLKGMKTSWNGNKNVPVETYIDKVLATASQQVCDSLSNIPHAFDDLTDERGLLDLQSALSCCMLIEDMCTEKVVVKASDTIRRNAQWWYCEMLAKIRLSATGEAFAETLQDALSSIVAFSERINKAFQASWKTTYTAVTILELDRVLDSELKPRIGALCCATFQQDKMDDGLVYKTRNVFYILRNFVGTVRCYVPNLPAGLEMVNYRSWFTPFEKVAAGWLHVACKRVVTLAAQAVQHDDFLPDQTSNESAVVSGSSSAHVAISSVRDEIFHLWEALDCKSEALTRKFADTVSACVVSYAELVEMYVKDALYFDALLDAYADTRLCVAVNNVTLMQGLLREVTTTVMKSFAYNGGPEPMDRRVLAPLTFGFDCVLCVLYRLRAGACHKDKEVLCMVGDVIRREDPLEMSVTLENLAMNCVVLRNTLHNRPERLTTSSLRVSYDSSIELLEEHYEYCFRCRGSEKPSE